MSNSTNSSAADEPFIAPICHDQITILYQDDDLLIINKPSGLFTLSGKHPLNKDSVHFRLVQDFPTALMPHRLDFGTSGIMLVALNKDINRQLCQQFSARTIKKSYIALLDGHLKNRQGIIDKPIGKDVFPRQKVCLQHGKPAQSHYEVLEYIQSPVSSRVRFTPITGRTHQLRIHSQFIEHPILGCDLYSNEKVVSMAERLMLHASSIEFTHPSTNEVFNMDCLCPF